VCLCLHLLLSCRRRSHVKEHMPVDLSQVTLEQVASYHRDINPATASRVPGFSWITRR